jgi:uridine kinase
MQCLSDLKNFRQTNIPVYSFTQHQRLDETKYLYGATIIIGTYSCPCPTNSCYIVSSAEGILALHDPEMRKLYDLKVITREVVVVRL